MCPGAPYFSILLCIMPDDFTGQVESSGVGMSRSRKLKFTDPINSDPIYHLISQFICGYRYLLQEIPDTQNLGQNANKTYHINTSEANCSKGVYSLWHLTCYQLSTN